MADEFKCGTFSDEPIPLEIRARMDADRAKAEAPPTARELIEAAKGARAASDVNPRSVTMAFDYMSTSAALRDRAEETFELALEALERCRNEADLRPPFFGDTKQWIHDALAAMNGVTHE